eukprot:TRINITY_DN16810_c0_g1_i1.p1 TRINITY_DN16810_c0_g1~~TRINITY_DN16810_c0_g1_i1.p1  ORF type:complete len:452 (+),score=88.97 TRINITY_DN16810_c0_g1_i1:60-1415(+)
MVPHRGTNQDLESLRFGRDGWLYSRADFHRHYKPEIADWMWDCALPSDLYQAAQKVETVLETYERVISSFSKWASFRSMEEWTDEESRHDGDGEDAVAATADAPSPPASLPAAAAAAKAANAGPAGVTSEAVAVTRGVPPPLASPFATTAAAARATNGAAEAPKVAGDAVVARNGVEAEEEDDDKAWACSVDAAFEKAYEFWEWTPLPFRISFWRHYDFIEVGTSDWGTLTQYCAGDIPRSASPLAAEIRSSLGSLRLARGLAVDAIFEYVMALPGLPRVALCNNAMAEASGEVVVHYVPPETIEKYLGVYEAPCDEDEPEHLVDVMWYAKSLSCVGRPHPELVAMLRHVGRLDLMEQRTVSALSWQDLCRLYGVASVDVVQLDCEGLDCAILRGLLAHCRDFPECLPRVLQFESNHLSATEEIEAILAEFKARGYTIRSRNDFNIIVERI